MELAVFANFHQRRPHRGIELDHTFSSLKGNKMMNIYHHISFR